MRTLLAGERATIAGARVQHALKVEVQNADGTWIDYSSYALGASWGEDIDTPVATATISFRRREAVNQSLAPLMSASTLNVNGVGAYAPALDVGRLVRISTATLIPGATPVSGDWREMFLGRINSVAWESSPITVECSDLGAWLMDTQIELVDKQYGSSGGTALETVVQQILNDSPSGKGAVPTLYKQSSSVFMVTGWTQGRTKVLEAVRSIVLQSTGEDVRFRHDASHVSRLTWFNPDRSRSTVDATIGPTEYRAVRALSLAIDDIRNAVLVPYIDAATGLPASYLATDATSQTNYGRRYCELGTLDGIDTLAEATTLGNAVVHDLSAAPALQEVELYYAWFVQLYDRYTFTANGDHYDQNQTFGVVGYRHELRDGYGITTIRTADRVVGAYADWLKGVQAKYDVIPPVPSLVALSADVGDLVTGVHAGLQAGTSGVGSLTYTLTKKIGKAAPVTVSSGAGSGLPLDVFVAKHLRFATILTLSIVDPRIATPITTVLTIPSQGRDGAFAAGLGHVGGMEDDARAGSGGMPTPRGRILTDPYFDASGANPLIDPATLQIGSALKYPNGVGVDALRPAEGGANVTETRTANNTANVDTVPATTARRGAVKGDTAIDASNIVVAAGLDLSRSYTGKHLGNLPDDATSDRRAATANEKTGGSRGFTAIDSSGIAVTAAIDLARAYTGKSLANIPDDATSDRRAATANEKTGGARGFTAIDAGGVAVASAVDFSRSYTGKHLGNLPDDATSDRRAATATEKTGGARGAVALDSANKLVTGVTAAATAADGVAGIESTKGANTRAARQAGAGIGRSDDDDRRSGTGGVPTPGGRVLAEPIYDATGANPLLDPVSMQIGTALKYPSGVSIDSLKPAEVGANKVLGLSGNKITPDSTNGRNRCKVYHSANQSIPDATATPLDWDSEVYDTGSLHSTSTNPSRITVPTGGNTGVWSLTAQIAWNGATSGGAGFRLVRIVKNSTTVLGLVQTPAVAVDALASPTVQVLTALDDTPAVGDYYTVEVYHNAGSARSVAGTIANSTFTATHLW